MSSNTSTTLDTVRGIVRQTGYESRISSDELSRIVGSANPRQVCEDIVRRLGGNPNSYRYVIDQIVAAVEAQTQGAPQDAQQDEPAEPTLGFDRASFTARVTDIINESGIDLGLVTSGGRRVRDILTDSLYEAVITRLDEACDTLRTGASRLGARSEDVEALLEDAGLITPEPEDETADEEDAPAGDQESINQAILSTLKKMNKRLKRVEKSL